MRTLIPASCPHGRLQCVLVSPAQCQHTGSCRSDESWGPGPLEYAGFTKMIVDQKGNIQSCRPQIKIQKLFISSLSSVFDSTGSS